MEKLDVKNRKILYELDFDSRQSFSQLGKKVGLHKDVVAYRVKKLQEKGIIKNFYSFIDSSKLQGLMAFRCYFSFQNISPQIKKEIIDYLVDSKCTNTVRSCLGNCDILFFIYVKSLTDLYSFWDKTLDKYREYFSKKRFSVYYQEWCYDYLFLLEEKEAIQSKRKILHKWIDSQKIVETDDLDYQICKIISQNSRLQTTEIAQQLNTTAVTIANRIKKLEESGIILGYRIDIDLEKLGYDAYKLDINIKNTKEYTKILNYLEMNPYLKYYIRSIGHDSDLEFAFCLNDVNQLNKIMEDLLMKFPDIIKSYNYFTTMTTHKVDEF